MIIALLAVTPLRRRTVAALRIGDNVIKSGNLWALDIAAKDTKTRRALDYPLSAQLSARIDVYLEKFRGKIPGAASHSGLWPSNLGSPMDGGGIYEAVRKRTRKVFLGDRHGREHVRPTDIEGEMRQRFGDFRLSQAVVHPDVDVAAQLRDLA